MLEREDHVELAACGVGDVAGQLDGAAGHLTDGEQVLVGEPDLAVHLVRGTRAAGGRWHGCSDDAYGLPSTTGPSGSAGFLEIRLMTSIRKPSTPRSTHQRIIA